MKEEIWKPVLGGWYEVSNLGQLKAMGKRKKIVKQYISKRGYYRYHVKKTMKNYSVHRLVAEAFIPNVLNLPQVNHIDGNRLNNCVENLEWVTSSENHLHAFATGLHKISDKQREKAKEVGVRVSKKVIVWDGLNAKVFPSLRAAGKAYNTRDTNVGRYCRKERNHKTLRFEYAA